MKKKEKTLYNGPYYYKDQFSRGAITILDMLLSDDNHRSIKWIEMMKHGLVASRYG